MNKTLLIAALIAAVIVYKATQDNAPSADPQDEDLLDSAMTKFDELAGAVTGAGPVEDMTTSQAMRDMLKRKEALRLTRYNLGDGGYTIGYGHFEKSINAIPERITRDEAEAMFDRDVEERGEKWVKLYVQVDLTQSQFDALVSIAYNMSPRSFKKFADAVNAGQGINGIANNSIGWVAASLQNGIANRRAGELNVFNNGVYA